VNNNAYQSILSEIEQKSLLHGLGNKECFQIYVQTKGNVSHQIMLINHEHPMAIEEFLKGSDSIISDKEIDSFNVEGFYSESKVPLIKI
jgi:hypothetical protein